MRQFRITYELDGEVSAYLIYASSKYNAKQRFYLLFPKANVIRVEFQEDTCDE